MPHIVFEKRINNYSITKDGLDFEFIAKSYNFTQKQEKLNIKLH